MKNKKNQPKVLSSKIKKTLIGVLAVIAAASLTVIVIKNLPSREVTIAFYHIDEQERKEINEVITQIAQNHKIAFKSIEYKSDAPLSKQPLRPKADIIFTTSGYSLESAIEEAPKNALLLEDTPQGMTSSMRSAIRTTDGKIAALPFLSSHLELNIELSEFKSSNIGAINTWNDVEKFLRVQKRQKDYPVALAGGDADFFLDFLGAMAESIDGVDSYNSAVKILEETSNPVKAATKLCDEPDSPLATSVKQLKSWYKLGFLHPGTFSFQKNDVEAFASSRLSSVLALSLENHRKFAQKTISRFSTIYFPSALPANSRIFTGKIYYAVPQTKSEKAKALLNFLVTESAQEDLCRATGLAPVLAQCRTPDKQSYEARYWIAATASPLAGLSNEVYISKEKKATIAAEIASRIKNKD